jgi:hypothetical protein
MSREAMQLALTVLERTYKMDLNDPQFQAVKALCTALAQPEKEWVGLTDEEKIKLRYLVDWTVPLDIKKFADSVEAKLKEKNT